MVGVKVATGIVTRESDTEILLKHWTNRKAKAYGDSGSSRWIEE
jgi:hypothetical protein